MTEQQTAVPGTEDFFDGVGGSGAPSFKFGDVGSGIRGEITDQFATQVTNTSGEKKFYDDGRPIPQLNVTLQTSLRNWDKVTKVPTDDKGDPKPGSEDTGLRRVYVKYDMRRAVGAALQEVKQRYLENGGELAIKLKGHKATNHPNPLPLYEARYSAPAPKPESDGFFEGESTQTSTAAETPPAPAEDDEPPF